MNNFELIGDTLPKLRHTEGFVDPAELIRKIQTVFNISHQGRNPEGTNKSAASFPTFEIGWHLSNVTSLKAPNPPPETQGPNVPELRNSPIGFRGLATCHAPTESIQWSWVPPQYTHDPMPDLPRANRVLHLLPYNILNDGRYLSTDMITAFVGELSQWKVSIPTPSKI